ncbi:MAG: DUF177 domain-containing protein [Pseudomonadota bacterium]|nr:DUF177 domain-containing protein [Pseudomonadota bacterium]
MSAPEFSRLVRVDTLGPEPRTMEVEAEEAEREALAKRFGLEAIARLAAEVTLVRKGEEVSVKGVLSAAATQACVATGEPVAETVETPFELVFRPPPQRVNAEEEVELSEGELDVIFYDGASVDLGEAVAETLFLSLDPYPRSASADAALREAGVKSEEEAQAESSPFAALGALKDKRKS